MSDSSGLLSAVGGPMGIASAGAGVLGSVLGAINDKPSKDQLRLNSQVGQFSSYLTSQAQREGLDASKVFNNLMGPLQRIVMGGPGQAGWNMEEFNAKNSAAINRGAAAARNLGSSAASGIAAINGGNTPGASAAERNAVLQQQANAENQTSEALANNQVADSEAGRENFFKAAEEETKLPSVFEASNKAGEVANEGNKTALDSQASVDEEKKASSGLGIASAGLKGLAGATSKLAAPQQSSGSPDELEESQGALNNIKAPSGRYGTTTPNVPAPDVTFNSPQLPPAI